MGILQVTLLGGVRVTHNNWRSEPKLTREIQKLLAYLLIQRHRAHPRDVLASVFWADCSQEKARRALNTALWRLKKALEPEGISAGTYLVSAQSGEVGFNSESQYWLDVEVFEQETTSVISYSSQAVDAPNVQALEGILELYKGELLEGLYDDWALRERERIRALYLKSLIYLMQYYKFHGLNEKASVYGQQILNLDPIREDIHREMMKLYLENGQRALAARQYGICQLTLAKELGISPMDETQILYAQIFPEAHKSQSSFASEEPLNFEQALGQLHEVSHTFDLARAQLQQTLEFFTKHIGPENQEFSTEVLNQGRADKARKRKMTRHSNKN
jgi:DNA-binding SARP family transcriptional activator